jgi:NADH-quinone oxidoreductase subunit H
VTWIDWGILAGKVVLVFVGIVVSVLLFIWMERKVIADMQTRVGPVRAGPRGVLLSLADGIKLFFKEGIRPTQADPWVYRLAPILAIIPGFLAFAIVPFGPSVHIFGRTVGLQLTDLSIGILWVLAMTSIAVYTVVLAGWSSGADDQLRGGDGPRARRPPHVLGAPAHL